MSPAGLVVNYTFRGADAHRNFSHLVSKVDLFEFPHARAHGVRARKSSHGGRGSTPRSGCRLETAIARAGEPIGFPRHAAQRFPAGLRRQLLPALRLRVSPQTLNTLLIARS